MIHWHLVYKKNQQVCEMYYKEEQITAPFEMYLARHLQMSKTGFKQELVSITWGEKNDTSVPIFTLLLYM